MDTDFKIEIKLDNHLVILLKASTILHYLAFYHGAPYLNIDAVSEIAVSATGTDLALCHTYNPNKNKDDESDDV